MADKTSTTIDIAPWISVPDADAAVAFYTDALGAERLEVLTDDDSGTIIVAQLAIGGADFWIQADPDVPEGSGGKPIRMILSVPDPDSVFEHAISSGAKEINAVSEDNGWRIGRISDPFGNHWEIGRRLED